MLVAAPELGPRRLLSCSAARAHLGSVDAWQFVPYSGQCGEGGRSGLIWKKLKSAARKKKSAPKENTRSGARYNF